MDIHMDIANHDHETFAKRAFYTNELIALTKCEQKIRIKPNDVESILLLSRLYHRVGNVDEAVRTLKMGLRIVPEDPIMCYILRVYEKQINVQKNKQDEQISTRRYSQKNDEKRTSADGQTETPGYEKRNTKNYPKETMSLKNTLEIERMMSLKKLRTEFEMGLAQDRALNYNQLIALETTRNNIPDEKNTTITNTRSRSADAEILDSRRTVLNGDMHNNSSSFKSSSLLDAAYPNQCSDAVKRNPLARLNHRRRMNLSQHNDSSSFRIATPLHIPAFAGSTINETDVQELRFSCNERQLEIMQHAALICVIGPPGSGRTSAAHLLCQKLQHTIHINVRDYCASQSVSDVQLIIWIKNLVCAKIEQSSTTQDVTFDAHPRIIFVISAFPSRDSHLHIWNAVFGQNLRTINLNVARDVCKQRLHTANIASDDAEAQLISYFNNSTGLRMTIHRNPLMNMQIDAESSIAVVLSRVEWAYAILMRQYKAQMDMHNDSDDASNAAISSASKSVVNSSTDSVLPHSILIEKSDTNTDAFDMVIHPVMAAQRFPYFNTVNVFKSMYENRSRKHAILLSIPTPSTAIKYSYFPEETQVLHSICEKVTQQEEDIDDDFQKFALPSEDFACAFPSSRSTGKNSISLLSQTESNKDTTPSFLSSHRRLRAANSSEIAPALLSKKELAAGAVEPIDFGKNGVPLLSQTESNKDTAPSFLSSHRRLRAANSSEIAPALLSKKELAADAVEITKKSNRPVPQPAPNKIISSPVNRNTYVGSRVPEAEWINSSVSGKNIPEEFVCMQFAVIAIDRVGKLGRVKPYLVLKRQHGHIFEEIARSEIKAPGSVDCSFEMFVLAAPVVCFNDYQRPIRIELWHSDSDGDDILISEIQTCVGDLDLLGKTANPAQRCITFQRSSDSKYKKENASISRFNGIEYSVPKTAAGLCVLQQIIIRYRTSMGVLLSNGRLFDHDADDVIKLELSVENLSKRKALRFELFAMHDVPDNVDAVANVLMSTNARLSSTHDKQEKSKESTLNADNEDMRYWRIAYASETSKPSCVLKFNGFVRRAHSLCQEDYDLPLLIKLIDGEQLFGKVCLTMRQILLSCSLESASGNPMDFPIAHETGHNKGSIRFKTADVYSTAADIETAAELSLQRLGISFDGSRLQMLEYYLEWLTKRDTIQRISDSRDKRSFAINSIRRLSRRTSSCNTNESIAMQNLDKTADDDKNQDEISALASIRDQNIEEYFADRAMPSYVALTLRADNLKVPFLAKLSGVKPVLSISRLIDGVWSQVYTASANVQENSSCVFPRVILKLKKLASNVEDSDNILDHNILVQVLNAKSKSSDIIGQERLTIRKLVALRGGYRVPLMSHKHPEKQTGSLVAISVKHKLRKRNTSNSTVQ